MTIEEAKVIIAIMKTADSGCSYCVGDLLDQFLQAFPEFSVIVPNWVKVQQNG